MMETLNKVPPDSFALKGAILEGLNIAVTDKQVRELLLALEKRGMAIVNIEEQKLSPVTKFGR